MVFSEFAHFVGKRKKAISVSERVVIVGFVDETQYRKPPSSPRRSKFYEGNHSYPNRQTEAQRLLIRTIDPQAAQPPGIALYDQALIRISLLCGPVRLHACLDITLISPTQPTSVEERGQRYVRRHHVNAKGPGRRRKMGFKGRSIEPGLYEGSFVVFFNF